MRLGRYELLTKIATGGMGEVFLARRRGPSDIEKRVVIKRIRRDLSGDPRFVELFLREARLSMKLGHKNIATVFDFGRAGAELFLAMEYVAGRDLARALRAAGKRNDGPLPATVAAHVGIEVCRALDYAHRTASDEPIVHRDLSPKNLLISFSGEVVVADFGLAIATDEQIEKSNVRGTPAYMAPEQARGEAVGPRSDLFSLGLVLYEIVAGEPAYTGESPLAIIERAKSGAPPALPDSVPEALRAIIERATAAEPDDRYPSAREMQLALDEFLVAERAAGAAPPGIALGTWLGELFEEHAAGEAIKGSEPIGHAVTFLDDGADAVAEEALGATAISLAATVGDSELDDADDADDDHDDEAIAPTPRRWPVVIAAAVLAALAVVIGSVSLSSRDGGERPDADAAVVAIDASPPDSAPVPDAPPPDAAPTPDAAPVDAAPAVARSGWVRVQSRPWARVRVARSGRGCPETPCRIKLPAGPATLILVNPVTKARATRRVTVRADETIDVAVSLPRPE